MAAVGDIVAGGLMARAVEPSAGAAPLDHGGAHDPGEDRCLNCGNFLDGAFCSGCGQVGHVHRSVGAFVHDLLHGVWHFDGKLWRTLPLLAWRPGELTRRYINGERARFISPLALFLFAVFLTFAVFSYLGSGLDSAEFDAAKAAETQTGINSARSQIESELADVRGRLAVARASGRPVAALEKELAEKEAAARVFQFMGISGRDDSDDFSVIGFKTGVPVIDAMIHKINDNPSLMLYKLQGNTYKYAWALIPLSAPFLWLLYPFSRRFAFYDHLVFVTYSISFMLLFAIALRVAAATGMAGGAIATLFFFYPPIHIYRQLRGAYRSSRFGALVRAILLVMIAVPMLLMFTTALLALGALG